MKFRYLKHLLNVIYLTVSENEYLNCSLILQLIIVVPLKYYEFLMTTLTLCTLCTLPDISGGPEVYE